MGIFLCEKINIGGEYRFGHGGPPPPPFKDNYGAGSKPIGWGIQTGLGIETMSHDDIVCGL